MAETARPSTLLEIASSTIRFWSGICAVGGPDQFASQPYLSAARFIPIAIGSQNGETPLVMILIFTFSVEVVPAGAPGPPGGGAAACWSPPLVQEASDRLEFERAGALRDKRQRLEDLRDRFDRMRFAAESLTFAYHVEGLGGDDRVYLIRRGVVRADLAAPKSKAEERSLKDAVRKVIADNPITSPRSM